MPGTQLWWVVLAISEWNLAGAVMQTFNPNGSGRKSELWWCQWPQRGLVGPDPSFEQELAWLFVPMPTPWMLATLTLTVVNFWVTRIYTLWMEKTVLSLRRRMRQWNNAAQIVLQPQDVPDHARILILVNTTT